MTKTKKTKLYKDSDLFNFTLKTTPDALFAYLKPHMDCALKSTVEDMKVKSIDKPDRYVYKCLICHAPLNKYAYTCADCTHTKISVLLPEYIRIHMPNFPPGTLPTVAGLGYWPAWFTLYYLLWKGKEDILWFVNFSKEL